jgi:hypothetical protein
MAMEIVDECPFIAWWIFPVRSVDVYQRVNHVKDGQIGGSAQRNCGSISSTPRKIWRTWVNSPKSHKNGLKHYTPAVYR